MKKQSYWQILTPIKAQIYTAMALSVLSVLFAMAMLGAMAMVVEQYITSQHIDWGWFSGSVVFALLSFFSRGFAFKTSHIAAFALEPLLRQRMTKHLAEVSLGKISSYGSSALAKIIYEDVRELHVFVADSTPLYARGAASPLLTLLAITWLDWRLSLVALAVLVIGMFVMAFATRDMTEMSRQYNESREDVTRSVVEFVQAMPVVRTFDGGQSSFGRYEKALDTYLNILVNWYRKNGTPSRIAMIVLNPLPTLAVLLWAGAYCFWQGDLAFSTWVAILLLGTGMAEMLMPLMALMHMVEKSKISIARIFDVLALPTLPVCEQPKTPTDASVTFEHVDFCYESRTENALTDVTFSVPESSFTALVGASGAGKSTVAKLIPRFWDTTGGKVLVGGIDVREIDPDVLMQHVAFVFQDNFLFTGTIADNVRLGQTDTNMDAIIDACKMAQAHEFISELPDGYDTEVGERGASLSGGQRQRITIARAILQNRPILVLDEATAFADAENEAKLMKAIHALMKGKTVLMIAHRLRTIANADQILVFADGKLAEAGAPDELLAKNGAYAELWQAYQQARSWTIKN